MPENRFFTSRLEKNQHVHLEDDELKHLLVMRPHIGDHIELIDGHGHLGKAEILSINKKEAILDLVSVHSEKPSTFSLILAQALPRQNRLDIILEKGTELGMTDLWLFPGTESEKTQLSEQQLSRVNHILVAAIKQCGRLFIPKIKIMPPLSKWIQPEFPLYFGDVRPNQLLLIDQWQAEPPTKGCIFVVGPEKGLSSQEVQNIEKLGGKGVSLNRNILRTDTAPLAALSLLSHLAEQNQRLMNLL